jgi:hypothetical protein
MSSIRSSLSSRLVVIGYALIVVGAVVLFINSMTEVYQYPAWYIFEIVMQYLMPAFVAIGAVTAWLLLGGALEHVESRRVRWGVVGFALQTFFLASISLAFFIVMIATSSAGISNWYITSQSFELAGGYLATAGFILMAVVAGRSNRDSESDPDDSPDDNDEHEEVDESPAYEATLPS